MYRIAIAVVDASRARLFMLERDAQAGGVREQLSERIDLVNPGRRLRPSALFSDSRPGTSRTGNNQYTFDDHRTAHIDKLDSVFARMVAEELERMITDHGAERLILCASPHMLGDLRAATERLRREPISLDEVPRDLVKLTPTSLRARLASYGLLPPPAPRANLARA